MQHFGIGLAHEADYISTTVHPRASKGQAASPSKGMSSSSSDSEDVGAAFNRWIRSLRLQDLPGPSLIPPTVSTTRQLSPLTPKPPPAPKSWNDLPLELKGRIMNEVFVSNFTNKEHSTMSPADRQPDMNLTDAVDGETRNWFEEKILPDTVVIMVNIYRCAVCDTPEITQHIDWFTMSADLQDHLSSKASSLMFTLECYETEHRNLFEIMTRLCSIGTIYVPQNKLNLLKLSETIFVGPNLLPNMHKRLTVHCNPRSATGVRQSVEVLNNLAELVHSMDEGINTVSWSLDNEQAADTAENSIALSFPGFPGTSNSWADQRAAYRAWLPTSIEKGSVQELLIPTLSRQTLRASNWTELYPVHRALFRECQTLLDTRAVAVHQVADVAVAAFRRYTTGWPIQRPTWLNPFVDWDKMENFAYGEVHTDCMLVVICYGLFDKMVRQLKSASNLSRTDQSTIPLIDDLSELQDMEAIIERRVTRMSSLKLDQSNGKFRSWIHTDLPYLIHQCAVLQAYIRYRMLYGICCHTFEGVLTQSQQDLLTMRSHALLWSFLDAIRNLNEVISKFRESVDESDEALFAAYDDYEIPLFLERWDKVFHLYRLGKQRKKTPAGWYKVLASRNAFDNPKRLRIPVIDTEDWTAVRRTFDDLNVVRHWYH